MLCTGLGQWVTGGIPCLNTWTLGCPAAAASQKGRTGRPRAPSLSPPALGGGGHWVLLGAAGGCWALLEASGCYWRPLGTAGGCWTTADGRWTTADGRWALLEATGRCWWLLGALPEAFCAWATLRDPRAVLWPVCLLGRGLAL